MIRNLLIALLLFGLLSCDGAERKTQPGMCAKEEMAADGIVRLSKVEVYPQYLNEYIRYVTEVGEISLRTEPGVLTMYAIGEKENPCQITILETYASREAYRQAHRFRAFPEIQARDAAHGQIVGTD